MHLDCNSGFTLDDIDLFCNLDSLNLKMIEQPLAFDDLINHSKLQKEISTPICLDESITSVDRAIKAIDINACGWINIKTSRVGGLTKAIAIQSLCNHYKLPIWVGGMLGSAVGQGPSIALATKGDISYPCNIFPSNRFFTGDFSEPEIFHSGEGIITAPSTPGIGFAPRLERLLEHAVQTGSL